MTSTLIESPTEISNPSVVAVYKNHVDAEAAVRSLASGGIPITTISIIGTNFQSHEDIQGYYRPADAALAGAGQGVWFGGIFGLFLGAFGFFVFPPIGALFVLGPLAGFVAGAIAGAGIGALVSALVAAGVPKNDALKYQERVQAGEFLVVVHGGNADSAKAHEILSTTSTSDLRIHDQSFEPSRN